MRVCSVGQQFQFPQLPRSLLTGSQRCADHPGTPAPPHPSRELGRHRRLLPPSRTWGKEKCPPGTTWYGTSVCTAPCPRSRGQAPVPHPPGSPRPGLSLSLPLHPQGSLSLSCHWGPPNPVPPPHHPRAPQSRWARTTGLPRRQLHRRLQPPGPHRRALPPHTPPALPLSPPEAPPRCTSHSQ